MKSIPSSYIKTDQEIETIRENGKLIAVILAEVAAAAVAGVSTWELDQLAERKIKAVGGVPAFKNFGPKGNEFPATLCTSVNDEIVHGVPSKKAILREGDIISLDIGMRYKGLYTDTAITVGVGKISAEAANLMDVTKKSLQAAINAAKIGNTIGDIGAATQKVVEAAGFSVVRDLVGHGVGYEVHEDPQVPGYGRAGSGLQLVSGMVLAIEPMVTVGSYKILVDKDDWTIRTADGSLSAHFEHTVAITKKGPRILTLNSK
jgi:methionyl aminopeptidase